MLKSSVETMKTDEMKVLDVLKHHANENARDLGKRCGFSPQKVARIIKNLEKQKRIWGYSTIEDRATNNLKHFLLLMMRNMEPMDESHKKYITFEKLDDYHPGSAQIEDIYFSHGKYNVAVTFYAPNIISAKNFVNEFFNRDAKFFKECLLLETLFPIRKQGLKNPHIEKLVEYL